MDALTLFGLFAVAAMMIRHALEDRGHWSVPAFYRLRPAMQWQSQMPPRLVASEITPISR